jgi:hypothetical protein
MKSRWYLAAFPVAFIACSGESATPMYGPASTTGGASNAKNAGGQLGVGGSSTNATGGVDNGSPIGGTTNSSSMAVRYGPISTLGSGGTQ